MDYFRGRFQKTMKQFLLKLKGSWGKLGNAELGNFASRQLYGSNPYNLKSGLSFSQAGITI
jgi:hypothetical protein